MAQENSEKNHEQKAFPGEPIMNARAHPDATLRERITAINRHIATVHDVCPLGVAAARANSILYGGIPKGAGHNPKNARNQIDATLREFVKKSQSRTCIMPFEDTLNDHDSAHQAAKNIFCEIAISGLRLAYDGATWNMAESVLEEAWGEDIRSPKGRITEPVVAVKNEGRNMATDSIIIVAFNPLYNPEHPRYLPFPAIVINWQEDVIREIMDNRTLVTRIHRNAVTGIACPFSEMSLGDLRKRTTCTHVEDPQSTLGSKLSTSMPLSRNIQAAVHASYDKTLYVFPPKI